MVRKRCNSYGCGGWIVAGGGSWSGVVWNGCGWIVVVVGFVGKVRDSLRPIMWISSVFTKFSTSGWLLVQWFTLTVEIRVGLLAIGKVVVRRERIDFCKIWS